MIRGEMAHCHDEEPACMTLPAVGGAEPVARKYGGPPALPPRDTETEIKLAATPAMLSMLRQNPLLAGPERKHRLVSTYFDTLGGRLSLAGASLRLRDKDGALEQTLKLAARNRRQLQRAEWNIALQDGMPVETPDIDAFSPRARHTLARLRKGANLCPFARVEVLRKTRQITYGGSVIEVAFDEGHILTLPLPAGEPGDGLARAMRSEPICELELELVSGCAADLLALAGRLPLGPELGWAVAGKAERAHALAYDRPRRAIRGATPSLTGEVTARRALQAIGWSCLIQTLGNIRLIIEGAEDTDEAVHQARVALRRLRAALGLFAALFDEGHAQKEAKALRATLADLTRMMSAAREAHVLYQRLAQGPLTNDAEGRAVLARLAMRAKDAVVRLRANLADAETQQALISIGAWLEGGAWLASAKGVAPVMDLVVAGIERRRARIRKRHRKLERLSEHQRHRLRLDVKKLRYAADFCAGMLPEAAARTALAHEQALAALQDVLGEWRDMAAPPPIFPDFPPPLAARLMAALNPPPQTAKRMLARSRNWLAREKRIAPWWHTES